MILRVMSYVFVLRGGLFLVEEWTEFHISGEKSWNFEYLDSVKVEVPSFVDVELVDPT